MRRQIALCIVLIVALGLCGPHDQQLSILRQASAGQSETTTTSVIGTWVREVRGQPGRTEGLRFEADGTFGLIGIHTMHGLMWRLDGDRLIVTTNTDRYPDPHETSMRVDSVTQASMTLTAPSGYLSGVYTRDDGASGIVKGVVTYLQRIALPKQAAVHVTLVEVSSDHDRGTFIAGQTVPTSGRQVPIPFALTYATADVDPGRLYEVRAVITVDRKSRFISPSGSRVITHRHPSQTELILKPFSGASPRQSSRQGMPPASSGHRERIRMQGMYVVSSHSELQAHIDHSKLR